MAVRDDAIVTVFDPSFGEVAASMDTPDEPSQAILIDAVDDKEAIKAARLAVERAKAQRAAAERCIAEWKAGATFSAKVLQRARIALGLRPDDRHA